MGGPVVIVTGAAGNLGQAVATLLGGLGYRLLLVDLNQPVWEGDSDAVSIGNVDLRLPEHADDVVSQAWEYFGQIDVLVNVAGGFASETQLEGSLDTWNALYESNVQTAVNMCQAILPQFQAQGSGVIVNTGAISGSKGTEGTGAYSAAKSAVLRLTEALAAENRRLGIRVNAVLPSILDTPANREAMPDADPEDWVTLDSLAGVIAFLLSDAARDIHGAGIPVTGRV